MFEINENGSSFNKKCSLLYKLIKIPFVWVNSCRC